MTDGKAPPDIGNGLNEATLANIDQEALGGAGGSSGGGTGPAGTARPGGGGRA